MLSRTEHLPREIVEHLECVDEQLLILYSTDRVIWDIQAMLRHHPEFQEVSTIISFQVLESALWTDCMFRLRALADQTKGTQSLWRLLIKTKRNLTAWRHDDCVHAIEPTDLERWIDSFNEAIKPCKSYTDKKLAHLTATRVTTRIVEVRRAIHEAVLTHQRITLVLRGTHLVYPPTDLSDRLAPFSIPWLPLDCMEFRDAVHQLSLESFAEEQGWSANLNLHSVNPRS